MTVARGSAPQPLYAQAVPVLHWSKERTDVEFLARDARISIAARRPGARP